MVCPSPEHGAQGEPSSSQERPQLLWLAGLTGAHLGLPPISQDPEDRCSIWENLVSLVDFQCPGFPLTSEELCHYIDIPRTPAVPRAGPPPPPGDIDYRTAPVKPPYSYATLICMALEASQKPKLTLADICKWIRDNFSYFRRAHPSWKSSIRHNLCINKRFVKVPREKGEPGRGAFWKLHPHYSQSLKSSSSEGRGTIPEPAPSRGAPQGARSIPSPPGPGCASRGHLEVGAELERLLREFEEFESSHGRDAAGSPAGQQGPQRCPSPPAQSSALPGLEEPGELTELKSSADWEALLSPWLEPGDFCALEQPQLSLEQDLFALEQPQLSLEQDFFTLEQPQLSPSAQPAALPPRPGWPQGQPQILPESGPAKPGLDETLLATAFLEAAWNEEPGENRPGLLPLGQGAENIPGSLPGRDVLDWDSLDLSNLY